MKVEAEYIKKAEILFREAEKDLQIGCYNKATSGFYFSIECLANAILSKHKQRVRGFRGRINAISIIVSRDIAKEMLYLYEFRVLADHKEKIISRNEAFMALKIARKIYSTLEECLNKAK